jgi:hypothetical protein
MTIFNIFYYDGSRCVKKSPYDLACKKHKNVIFSKVFRVEK